VISSSKDRSEPEAYQISGSFGETVGVLSGSQAMIFRARGDLSRKRRAIQGSP
jgi:hypothetical protein